MNNSNNETNKSVEQILKIEDDLLSREHSVTRSMYGCIFLGLMMLVCFFILEMSEEVSDRARSFLSWQPFLFLAGYFWYRSKSRHIESIKYYRNKFQSNET